MLAIAQLHPGDAAIIRHLSKLRYDIDHDYVMHETRVFAASQRGFPFAAKNEFAQRAVALFR